MSDDANRVQGVEVPPWRAATQWRAVTTPTSQRWPDRGIRPLLPGEESQGVAVAGAVGIIGGITLVFWLSDHVTYDTWGPMVVALVLIWVSTVVIRRTAALSEDPLMVRLLTVALALKLISALVRRWIGLDVYGGLADSGQYHATGLQVADSFRQGILSTRSLDLAGTDEGHNISVITGAVYTVLGRQEIVGFLAFAWFGFLGQILFFRAFLTGVEHGNQRRYALLVFFLPSLLYWPSSIGKEAYMMFAIGLATLGVAHLLGPHPRARGALYLALGVVTILQVRPHMAAIVVGGIAIGAIARRPGRLSVRQTGPRVLLLLILVPLLLVSVNRMNQFFGADDLTAQSVDANFEYTRDQTTTGGSQFETTPVTSPADLPAAVISVLFRPFPWEIHSATTFAAAAEGLLLVGLVLACRHSLAALPRQVLCNPYLAYVVGYSILFIIAFSNIGNIGILARQRTQLLPILLTLLALQPLKTAAHRSAEFTRHPEQGSTGGTSARSW